MKLSIIIVNYNVKYFLEQCLHSVLQAVSDIEAEIWVIDNDSTDGSLEYLRPLFPLVKFIAAKQNLGFGKANNLVLTEATGEYILFLNPDTIVPEDCFTKCLNFFYQHSKAGALGVRMLEGTGRFLPESKRSFPGISTAFYKAIGLSGLFPGSKIFNRYSLGYLHNKQNHSVEVLAGAFMMVRKKLLDEIGAFDEQFFMYGEDIDLSYRLKQAGFENWYFAETSIIHFKGESLKKWSADHVKVFYQAMIIFVKKHYRGKGTGFLTLLLVLGIRSKSIVSLLKGYISGKSKPPRQKINARTIVVGTPKDFEQCLQIYGHDFIQNQLVWNYEPKVNDFAAELDLFCIEKDIEEIVFCSSVTYFAIILAIQQLKRKYSYRFHASESKSIISSNSKSNTGEALYLN